MKRNYQILSILVIYIFFVSCCNLMKCSDGKLFNIKDAYYQSWVASEKEKGTNIFIKVANVKDGVVFDSLIFRGIKLPVFTEVQNEIMTLKAIVNIEISRISLESVVVNKPDQLLYRFQEAKHSYILKKIRREKMRYY